MTWEDSFAMTEAMVDEYERIAKIPADQRKRLEFPWQSWRKYIDPLEDGMLGAVTAPDGQGKTIYAESIAEYWAEHKNRVVFVHYELNRKLMMMRRIARHTSIKARLIKDGQLTSHQREEILNIRPRLLSWDGFITYVHTPGWTMEKTIGQLTALQADNKCDAVVLDYLEKVAPSRRQIQLFGTNVYQREADNVEQLKNFAESTGVPVLMIAQMSKAGKTTSYESVDRTAMRGAGEKSDKANLVVLLSRERINDENENAYSNEVKVLIDKNTMGQTGQFTQYMQPEYFRVGDLVKPY
jgi:replicative DNA helicase